MAAMLALWQKLQLVKMCLVDIRTSRRWVGSGSMTNDCF